MPEVDRRVLLRSGLLGLALLGSTLGTQRLAAGTQRLASAGRIDVVYKGRHIRGSAPEPGPGSGTPPQVYIDDVELHVMTLPGGGYTSVLNHYQSFGGLLPTARAAVDNLRGAALVPHR
jgi:hypothetical protein